MYMQSQKSSTIDEAPANIQDQKVGAIATVPVFTQSENFSALLTVPVNTHSQKPKTSETTPVYNQSQKSSTKATAPGYTQSQTFSTCKIVTAPAYVQPDELSTIAAAMVYTESEKTSTIATETVSTRALNTRSQKPTALELAPVYTHSLISSTISKAPVYTHFQKSSTIDVTPMAKTKEQTSSTVATSAMRNKTQKSSSCTITTNVLAAALVDTFYQKSSTIAAGPVNTLIQKSSTVATAPVNTQTQRFLATAPLYTQAQTSGTAPLYNQTQKSGTCTVATGPLYTQAQTSGAVPLYTYNQTQKSSIIATAPVNTESKKSSTIATAPVNTESKKYSTVATAPVNTKSKKSSTIATAPVNTKSKKSSTVAIAPVNTKSKKSSTVASAPVNTQTQKCKTIAIATGFLATAPLYTQTQTSGTAPLYNQTQTSGTAPLYTVTQTSGTAPLYNQTQTSGTAPLYNQTHTSGTAPLYNQTQTSGTAPLYTQTQTSGTAPLYNQTQTSSTVATAPVYTQSLDSATTTTAPVCIQSQRCNTVLDKSDDTNNQLQCEAWHTKDELITSVTLRSDGITKRSIFDIDIIHKKEPRLECLLLQVANCESHVIFQSFISNSRASQCLCFTCQEDVFKTSLVTVTAHGLQTSGVNSRVWYNVLAGGKRTVSFMGGMKTNYMYMMMTIQPLGTYLPSDFFINDSKQTPYHVDVVSIGLRQYMLTNLNHGSEHTDGVILLLHQIHPPAACIMFYHGSATVYGIPFDLKPATEYKLQLFNTRHVMNDVYVGNSHSTVTTFTTYMTQHEVFELYIKAVNFLSNHLPDFANISIFYRNKSDEYFSKIMSTDGVMHKYIKNWGGDQASTLNRQVQGLFFSASVDQTTRLPPDFSYFGSVRLHVPTYLLLNNNINMYFSDFYCHRVNHKVQLVLAVKDSPTDRFCRPRLVLVDQYNNPFLTRVRIGFSEAVRVTMNVTVEVFYTEDVPIRDMMCHRVAHFTRTKQKGTALAMVNGIPKNRNCKKCNLARFLLAKNML